MTLATNIALKYHGMGWRSCSARIVPQRGHSPSSPKSSSSTSASHSSHHAIRSVPSSRGPLASLATDAHPELHRRRAQFELLAQPALDVANVGLRQPAVGEEGEGRGVDGTLDDVTDLGPGC